MPSVINVHLDDAQTEALRELRRMYEDLPTQSEAVRRAIVDQLKCLREKKGRK